MGKSGGIRQLGSRAGFIGRGIVVALVVWMALAVGGAGPASAQLGGATLSSNNVARNADVTISGGGFAPNSPVDALVDGGIVAMGTADGSGNATLTFRSTDTGIHRARLQGANPAGELRILANVFSVLDGPCNPACGPQLPATGRTLLLLTGLGLLLVVGGAAVLTPGGRRAIRRHAAPVAAGALTVGLAALVVVVGAAPRAAVAQAGSGTISGRVTNDATDAGVQGVCAHAIGATFGAAISDTDGNYTIANLPPGTYRVGFEDCATAPRFFRQYFSLAASYQGAMAIQLEAGQTRDDIDVELKPAGTLSGRVTADGSGAPVEHACVRLGTDADNMHCRASTGTSGAFQTEPVLPAQYIVAAQPSGTHAIRYLGGANNPAQSQRATINAGSAVGPANFVLPQGATISGTVTDAATGQAPARGVCIASLSNDVPTLASAFAGQNGTFEIGNVPPGTHKVRFTDCGGAGTPYVTQFFDAKPSVAAADPVALTAGQARSGVNAAMSTSGVPTTTSTTTTTTVAGGATTIPSGATTTIVAGPTATTAPGGGATAPAATAPPAAGPATLSASTLTPGSALTVSGAGFAPGSPVVGYVFSTPVEIGRVTADASGRAVLQARLPANLTPGTHQVQLHGVDPAGQPRVLGAPLTVRSAGSLGRTGVDVGYAMTLAGLFLLLGAALVRLGRRRSALL